MATFTSATAFAEHVAGYGKKVEKVTPNATRAAAEVAAIAIRQSGSHFHIKGRTGRKWNLGAKVTGPYPYAGNWIAYVDADPAGFWMLIEKGWYKKPGGYEIRPRRGRRGAGGKRALSFNGTAFARVHHPGFGSIGHPWEIGVVKAGMLAPKAFEREIVNVFGVAA